MVFMLWGYYRGSDATLYTFSHIFYDGCAPQRVEKELKEGDFLPNMVLKERYLASCVALRLSCEVSREGAIN